MSGEEIVVAALLAVGVLLQLTSVLGILVARDVYDRIHFTEPAGIFTPIAIAIAVVIDFGPLSQAGIKAVMIAVLIVLLAPALVHATARAAHIREHGRLELSGREPEPEPPPGPAQGPAADPGA